MAKVETAHSGKFTLTGYGQKMSDGQFQATFTVTEHKGNSEEDTKVSTGKMFDTADEAESAGVDAAKVWLDVHRPVNN